MLDNRILRIVISTTMLFFIAFALTYFLCYTGHFTNKTKFHFIIVLFIMKFLRRSQS